MATILTPELLKQYFNEGKRNAAYVSAINTTDYPLSMDEKNIIDIYNELRYHADGIYPCDIIDKQRPSEPPEVQAYRKEIFQAVTKETVSRIITCLSKIRRSTDWSVRFDPKTVNASIIEQESPEEYFDKRFPNFTSLTNWLFAVCLRNYLIDANGICAVIPLNTNAAINEYYKPFPYIFNSDQVLEYLEGDYCIIKSKDLATYVENGKTYNDGKIFWVFSTERIQKWSQVSTKGNMDPTIDFVHGIGYMPAFKLGGIFLRSIDQTYIYESRIQPIVPRLNKAVREDNDLDVSVVRHLFPEKWEHASFDCPKCVSASGKMINGTTCKTCKGVGKVVSSPFQTHLVSQTDVGKNPIPIPPAGYIQKDVEIIKLQDQRIEKHISKALATINMEFLSKTPLNESGTAKEVDKDELNNFVHSIAEDIVAIMDKILKISYDIRYQVRVPDQENRNAMLPAINVPEKFDMLSVNYLLQEYQQAKTAKLNPVIVAQMELEISAKKFSTAPEIKDELTAILKLDPFAGMNSDDKMAAAQNGWATDIDFIISTNIVGFVRNAVFEDPKFYTLPMDKQREKMEEYADEKSETMSAAGKVRAMEVVGNDEENIDDADTAGAANI